MVSRQIGGPKSWMRLRKKSAHSVIGASFVVRMNHLCAALSNEKQRTRFFEPPADDTTWRVVASTKSMSLGPLSHRTWGL
jgi:hypothetical protein